MEPGHEFPESHFYDLRVPYSTVAVRIFLIF